MTRIASREVLLATLAAIGFALAFSHQILGRLGEAGFHQDWDLLWQLHWVSYYSVAHFHQFPLWNPYKCGGMPLLANPHSRILTPFFLLHLLFGPFVGLHLEIPLHLAIAWGGGYLLARILGLSPLAALVCATVFPASSWFFLHLAVGHVVYLPSLYLPWIAALAWLSISRRRLSFAALAGLLVALTLGEGGVYPMPQAFLLVGLLTLAHAAARRSLWPFLSVVTVALFAIGFAAPKLLPSSELVRAHPGLLQYSESHTFTQLLTALLSRDQDAYRPTEGTWPFHEYGAYVGWLATVLAVVGAASSPRRAGPWVLAGTTFLLLSMGDAFGAISPWTLLHHLPVFSSERVAPRFLIPLTLTVGVLAAFGVDFLRTRLRPLGGIVAHLLVAALVLDLWWVGPPALRHVFGGEQTVRPPSREFRQAVTTAARWEMLSFARANMGAVECYEFTLFRTRVRGEGDATYRGEQYLLGPGSVRLVEWTPNRLCYEVETDAPTLLVVNQNYDGGWRLTEGEGEVVPHDGDVVPEDGLLAVRLGPGAHHVTLVYRSDLFCLGLAIAAMTCVALLALTRAERGRA